jgi:hypothetical protein
MEQALKNLNVRLAIVIGFLAYIAGMMTSISYTLDQIADALERLPR